MARPKRRPRGQAPVGERSYGVCAACGTGLFNRWIVTGTGKAAHIGACHDALIEKAKKMRLPTSDEKIKAIMDARSPVFEYLQGIGKTEAFDGFSKDEMCGLIRAAQEGVQASLKQQVHDAFEGEIPW